MNRDGFTLVELLIVVVIVSILVLMLGRIFAGIPNDARSEQERCRTDYGWVEARYLPANCLKYFEADK